MKKWYRVIIVVAVGISIPNVIWAQDGGGIADDIKGLRSVLDQIYNEMIPMCSQLIGVGRGLAGFAALWYIAYRVWRHLASAEPIDFYPLFRPFTLGLCILLFPAVIDTINGVLQPLVAQTDKMVQNTDVAIAALLQQKEDAIKQTDVWQMYVGPSGEGDKDKWYQYTHPGQTTADEGFFEGIGDDIKFAMSKASYNFRNAIKEVMAEALQILFAAASLCINTMRTFNLIIMAILGPIAFGLSVFDGFHHTLKHWLSRYINVFLWLPVANIFGSVIGQIQENMLKLDISQINQTGDTFFSKTDAGYLVFLIIGIFGYFTVPSIASHIMWVGGGDALTAKTTGEAGGVAGGAINTASGAAMTAGAMAGATASIVPDYITGAIAGQGSGASSGGGQSNQYMRDKLSGDKNNG